MRALSAPKVFVPLVSAWFLGTSFLSINENVNSAKGRKDLLEGDTGHYLSIARDFARGDFSMGYVQARPHRQPLYPFLLSPVFRFWDGDLRLLATVNVVLINATFVVLYFGLLRLFGSRTIASVIGILFLQNPFVHAHATRHLLTEPLHLLLAVSLLFVVMHYLLWRKRSALIIAGALAGLDYLTRPNGLFIFASLIAALIFYEGWRLYRNSSIVRFEGKTIAISFVLVVLAFVVVSAPSWIPRLQYFGNPIHHGYLINYLWTDSYRDGHVGQRFATYSSKDYFAKHGTKDVVIRWVHGIKECGFAIPIRTEEKWPILYFLALAGFLTTLWKGAPTYRILALFGTLQMLPLVWTNMSNPTIRVPYAAELPFELIFAALFLYKLPCLHRFSGVIRSGRKYLSQAQIHPDSKRKSVARQQDATVNGHILPYIPDDGHSR